MNEVLRSGWLGLGPVTSEFENNLAEYLDCSHAIAVNSCTAALDLALRLLDIAEGDEVIVPTMTFVSTAHVVLYNRATVVFADVDPTTLCIDVEDLQRRITERTKAIIVVHFGGRPVDMDAVKEVAGNIPVVEDCAHAAGAVYKGRKCGNLGTIGCFSFHAVKNMTTGDGGALALNDLDLARRANRLRWLGIDKSTWDRSKVERKYWWDYNICEVGFKCHMNDIAAALGNVQLRRLDELNRKRKAIVKAYIERLKRCGSIELPEYTDDSSWHIFFIKTDCRDDLSMFLQEKGIATGVHYRPIHLYECYGREVSLPAAEEAFKKIITLPVYPDLSPGEVDTISDLICDHVGRR